MKDCGLGASPRGFSRANILALVGGWAATFGIASTAFSDEIRTDPAQESPQASDAIVIIRHAEKPSGDGPPFGVVEDGSRNSGSLTVRGWMRAGALANAFGTRGVKGANAWGVSQPTALFASAAKGPSSGLRAVETLDPLARHVGVPVDTTFARGNEEALATRLLATKGVRLVAWEHHSIPAIVSNLGKITPAPPPNWPDNRYDAVWCFERRTGPAWHFRETWQDLLDGDRPRDDAS